MIRSERAPSWGKSPTALDLGELRLGECLQALHVPLRVRNVRAHDPQLQVEVVGAILQVGDGIIQLSLFFHQLLNLALEYRASLVEVAGQQCGRERHHRKHNRRGRTQISWTLPLGQLCGHGVSLQFSNFELQFLEIKTGTLCARPVCSVALVRRPAGRTLVVLCHGNPVTVALPCIRR